MSQADCLSITSGPGLITTRRNFFTRAFGLTAAGATVAVPVLALSDPAERLAHHVAQVEAALREMYPGAKITTAAEPIGRGSFDKRIGCWIFTADVRDLIG